MRSMLAAALGAVLALATASPSVAAKLVGKPFLLLDGDEADLNGENVHVYQVSNNSFGLLYGQANQARTIAKLYLRLFASNGKPTHPKALVFKQSRQASGTAFKITPAGAVVLANGKTIVAANLTNGADAQRERLLGQTMAITARDGEPYAFEQSGSPRVSGRMLQSNFGGGVIFWHEYDAETGAYQSFIHAVGRTGVWDRTIARIVDRPITDTILRPSNDGYVETTTLDDSPQTGETRYSRWLTSSGVGYDDRKMWREDKNFIPSAAVGLDKKTIGHVAFDKSNGGMSILMFKTPFESYKSGRVSITGNTTLANSVSYARGVTPMTDGRFTSAWADTTADATTINVRVYAQNGASPGVPIQIGDTAKIKLPTGSSLHQLIPLVTGDILAVVIDNEANQLKGQLIKP